MSLMLVHRLLVCTVHVRVPVAYLADSWIHIAVVVILVITVQIVILLITQPMHVSLNHVSMAGHVHALHQRLMDHLIHIPVLALQGILELIVKCLIVSVLRLDIVSMVEHVMHHLLVENVRVQLVGQVIDVRCSMLKCVHKK